MDARKASWFVQVPLQRKVLMPIHTMIVHYVLVLLDDHLQFKELNELVILLKSQAQWTQVSWASSIRFFVDWVLTATAILVLTGKDTTLFARKSDSETSWMLSPWQRVLLWIYPHVEDSQQKVIYRFLLDGSGSMSMDVLLSIAGMPIQENDRSRILHRFCDCMCFPNILFGVDVAHADGCREGTVLEEERDSMLVDWACLQQGWIWGSRSQLLCTLCMRHRFARKVIENLETTGHDPVKFLYEGVFDMLSIMLDDMLTDPKDAEEIPAVTCRCDICVWWISFVRQWPRWRRQKRKLSGEGVLVLMGLNYSSKHVD